MVTTIKKAKSTDKKRTWLIWLIWRYELYPCKAINKHSILSLFVIFYSPHVNFGGALYGNLQRSLLEGSFSNIISPYDKFRHSYDCAWLNLNNLAVKYGFLYFCAELGAILAEKHPFFKMAKNHFFRNFYYFEIVHTKIRIRTIWKAYI